MGVSRNRSPKKFLSCLKWLVEGALEFCGHSLSGEASKCDETTQAVFHAPAGIEMFGGGFSTTILTVEGKLLLSWLS